MEKWNGSLFPILFGMAKWQSLGKCFIGSEAEKNHLQLFFSLRMKILFLHFIN